MDSQRKTHPFSASDFIYTEAIDTYKIPNKKRHTISLPENKRNQFFSSHPRVSALLKREIYNPLLEEGKKSGYERDRNGEYYLTREALSILIHQAKIKYRDRPDINVNNIFVFDKGDANSILKLSRNIKLQSGEDAKLIIFYELHAVMIYIRNENEQIKVFVIDSEPNSLLDIAAISKFFMGNIFLVLNTTPLQKDLYSCVTFSYKALLYFMKHGAEVFPYLENKIGKNIGCFALNSTELMPNLLKMSQSTLNLPDSVLDTVVSKKNGETLRQYWERNQSNFDGKKFNVAAITKKYKYLTEIENYLATQNISDQEISPQQINKLPKLFAEAKDELLGIDMPEREMIIDVCIKIANGVDDYETQSLKKILTEKMPQFISSLEHFEGKDKADQDNFYLHKILYFAALAECFVNLPITNPEELINKSQGYAKKLLRLFGNSQQALSYLKKFWTITDPEPLTHLCAFELPLDDEGWNKTYWSSLLMHYGKKANLYLSIAKELEPKMQNKSILDKNIFIFLQSLAKDVAYPRAKEFPELANICIQYGKSNQVFEHCLFDYKIGWIKKTGDLLPDLVTYFYKTTNNQIIECKTDKPHKRPDYTFKKIPYDSFKPLFLGEETKCCQSIDGAGRSVVMEGMSSCHSAFYIVLDKKNRIIIQSWGWINGGKFCFDSIEYTNVGQRNLLPLIYEPIAQKIVDEGFSSVHVGTGGETPYGVWKMAESLIPLRKENLKSDATTSQYVIHPGNDLPFYERFIKACEKNNFILKELSPDKTIHELFKLLLTHNPHVSAENYYELLLFLYRNDQHILTILLDNNDFTTLNRLVEKMGDLLKLFLYVPDLKMDRFLLTIKMKMPLSFSEAIGNEGTIKIILNQPIIYPENCTLLNDYNNKFIPEFYSKYIKMLKDYEALSDFKKMIDDPKWDQQNSATSLFCQVPDAIKQARNAFNAFPTSLLELIYRFYWPDDFEYKFCEAIRWKSRFDADLFSKNESCADANLTLGV